MKLARTSAKQTKMPTTRLPMIKIDPPMKKNKKKKSMKMASKINSF